MRDTSESRTRSDYFHSVLDKVGSICYINNMENTNNALASSGTQQSIIDAVQTELVKRGFNAKLSAEFKTARDFSQFLEITSEPFNTVPVIMKEIKITGRISASTEEGNAVIKIAGRIGVEYSHFGGGRNGTELFNIRMSAFTNDDRVAGVHTY